MAETPSTMKPLGFALPNFSLPNVVTDQRVSTTQLAPGKPVLVMFICNHCPYVEHVVDEFKRLEDDFAPRGLQILAISSNDVSRYPQDGPRAMRELALHEGWSFPYLFDDTQEVARTFDAACTPDFFLFDRQHRLAYRGQLDDSRPRNSIPVTGQDLRAAITAVLDGKSVPQEQKPSVGCNIKWKSA